MEDHHHKNFEIVSFAAPLAIKKGSWRPWEWRPAGRHLWRSKSQKIELDFLCGALYFFPRLSQICFPPKAVGNARKREDDQRFLQLRKLLCSPCSAVSTFNSQFYFSVISHSNLSLSECQHSATVAHQLALGVSADCRIRAHLVA